MTAGREDLIMVVVLVVDVVVRMLEVGVNVPLLVGVVDTFFVPEGEDDTSSLEIRRKLRGLESH